MIFCGHVVSDKGILKMKITEQFLAKLFADKDDTCQHWAPMEID